MCDRSQIAVIGVDHEHNRVLLLDTQCKCYACEQCRDAIRRVHQARIIYGAKEYAPWAGLRWSFVTLTAHEKTREFKKSLELFQRALPLWRKRMKRRYGDFGYVLVFEQHKSGAVHAHLLINCSVSKKWVRRHARAVGLGYMADVQRLHAAAAAGKYVSKYISKSLADAKFPKRFKRVRYSHNWPELPKPSSSIRDWTAVRKREDELQRHVQAAAEDGLAVRVDAHLRRQFPLLELLLARLRGGGSGTAESSPSFAGSTGGTDPVSACSAASGSAAQTAERPSLARFVLPVPKSRSP